MKKLFVLFLLFPLISQAKLIKVMVIDTGVSLDHKEIAQHVTEEFSEAYVDNHGHGTHVAGIIVKNTCSEVKLISCKFSERVSTVIECLESALKKDVQVINFSGGGQSFSLKEYTLLKELSDRNVKIIVAAGNDGKDLSLIENDYYPAKYEGIKNLIPVGNLIDNNVRSLKSNYGLDNMKWEIGQNILSTVPYGYKVMSGTSQATAVHTNRLLREKCNEKR